VGGRAASGAKPDIALAATEAPGRSAAGSSACTDVAAQVTQEVHDAALPRRTEDLRERGLQPGVGIADGQLDADQPTCD